MINVKDNLIELNNGAYPILKYEVWFQTPLGLFTNAEEATQRISACDLDPLLLVHPVAVAVADSGIYEVAQRGF